MLKLLSVLPGGGGLVIKRSEVLRSHFSTRAMGERLRLLFDALEGMVPKLDRRMSGDSLRDDPTLGHFDLVHTAKREEELHKVCGRILRDLADNAARCVGNSSVENDRAHPHACKIHPHLLTVT